MKLYCIGIGPGGEEQMTLRAVRALEKCDCVAGYGLYLDLIENLIEGKERVQTGMTKEVDRCTAARRRAISASRCTIRRAKNAPAICSARATSCSRPPRPRPCAVWCATSAAKARHTP